MNRIPKSAQRAIDKANRERATRIATTEAQIAALPTPRIMQVGVTPRNIMNMYDVYFNGVKQKLCTLADVEKGMIRRWTRGVGRFGDTTSPQEECYGKVEIKRKSK